MMRRFACALAAVLVAAGIACQLVDPLGDLDRGGSSADAASTATCDADINADPTNCGRCGRRCNGPCNGGACAATSFAERVQCSGLAWSAGTLYYGAGAGSTDVGFFTLDTTTRQRAPFVTGQPDPVSIAVQAPYVFWADVTGAVRRAGLDGGGMKTIATGALSTSQGPGAYLAANSKYVYWIDGSRNLMRAPVSGAAGAGEMWAPGAVSVAANEQSVIFSTANEVDVKAVDTGAFATVSWPGPGASIRPGIALAGTHGYFTSVDTANRSVIWHFVIGDDPAKPIATASHSVWALAADGAGIYWTTADSDGGGVEGCDDPVCGSPVMSSLVDGSHALALDPKYAYFGALSNVDIYAFPR
jgi:hypothetical protein